MREHNPRDVRLENPRDRERVAGRLQRDLIVGVQAAGEEFKRPRIARDAPRPSRRPLLTNRHLAELAMHIQPDRPQHPSSLRR